MTHFKLKPGVVTSLFVSIGAFLDIFNIYDFFVSKCGAGAMVVITSFGHFINSWSIIRDKKEWNYLDYLLECLV